MERQRLLKTLEELRTELAQTERVDPATLAKLEELTSELQHELEKPDAKRAAKIEPTTRGLKDLLLDFESEHPQLSAAVGKVADALAAMGF
jgi:ABC-type transporter Mla MlaB component